MDILNEDNLLRRVVAGDLTLDELTPEQRESLEKHLRSEIPSYISQDLDLVGLIGVYNQRVKHEMEEKLKKYVEDSITSRLVKYYAKPMPDEPDFEKLSEEEEWKIRNNLAIKIESMIQLGILRRSEIPYRSSFKEIFNFVNQREAEDKRKQDLAFASSMSKAFVSLGEDFLKCFK